MKKLDNVNYEAYEVLTQGHSRGDVLIFRPEKNSCGSIRNGVVLSHGIKEGGWLISYVDLIEMARLATEARKKK